LIAFILLDSVVSLGEETLVTEYRAIRLTTDRPIEMSSIFPKYVRRVTVSFGPPMEGIMDNVHLLHTHVWSDGNTPRQIMQDGRTIIHQRCLSCGRDFALELDGSGWHAIYVGAFRVELLAESVTRRWLGEECPKQPLWDQDQKARAMRQS
jgi:hypothetical protein